MSSKNPEKSLQRSQISLVHEHGKGNLANRKLLRPASTKRMLFLKQENSAASIQLRFKELCDGFYPLTQKTVSRILQSTIANSDTGTKRF